MLGWCLDSRELVLLKEAGIQDETIRLMIQEKTIETGALSVQEILDMKQSGIAEQTIQMLIQEQMPPATVVGIALANPLQVFRTAAMMLFDPDLVLLGPSAFVILDAFGKGGYLAWALAYPTALGSLCAALGFALFRRGDLP